LTRSEPETGPVFDQARARWVVAPVADYRTFFGFSSRNAVWIVAQIHLMFGAFVLGVPIFASIVEVIGWRTRALNPADPRRRPRRPR
jgi:hypothetical protein